MKFLILSKIESGQIDLDKKPFELRKLVTEIVDMHGLAAKQLRFRVGFHNKQVGSRLFAGRFRSAVANINKSCWKCA